MLYYLPFTLYASARPLFARHDNHLATKAVLAGEAGWGQVWVNSITRPTAGALRSGPRFYLAGDPSVPGLKGGLARLFSEEIFPAARADGYTVCLLFYDRPEWEAVLEGGALAGRRVERFPRRAYEFKTFPQDWRCLLGPGDEVRRIDRALLAEAPMEDPDHFREEITSECPTVDFFLEHRFGFAFLREGRIAGWCLSEYNCGDRCEIGIETLEPYQRQGVATVTTGALVEHAQGCGITRIGWDCWAGNSASVATALRSGFSLVEEYQVYVAWVDS